MDSLQDCPLFTNDHSLKKIMSTYIPLGKAPISPEERSELLGKIVEAEEHLANIELSNIQRSIVEFLVIKKGYSIEDIELNKKFKVDLPDASFIVKSDIILKANNKIFLVIKCAVNSLESWERYSVAFCRVIEAYQVPYAVVTDGKTARILDVVKYNLISDSLDAIPTKEEACQILKDIILPPCAEERCIKEKRILHAFEAIRCNGVADLIAQKPL